jgi:hypothetical protein
MMMDYLKRKRNSMKEKAGLLMILVLMCVVLLGGCATQQETVQMRGPGGQQEQTTMPKSTWTGAASGTQADALAQEIVQANNNTMKQFDQVEGQGTGQVTLFFKTGSAQLDKFQTQRLIEFLDYLGRESRGRTVILLSIGGASATGSHQGNKKLSIERSQAPMSIIEQYLINVPHKFYKVTGIGDMYAPKGGSMKVEERYQNVRIVAAYDTANLPATPGK